MHEQGNAEIDGGLEDRGKFAVVQIKTADIGGDMTADKTMIADTAAQFTRGRFRILHRQQGPAAKAGAIRRDRRRQSVIEHCRRLDRERRVEMIVDERSRERQHHTLDPVALHPLDLLFHLEEGRVQAEVHTANIEIDGVAFLPLDRDSELGARTRKPEELIRNVMAVDIGDHD